MRKKFVILTFFALLIGSSLFAQTQIIVGDADCERKIDEVIAAAESKLGCKYVWAANGPEEFDCSGFAQYVFAQAGIELTRSTETQCKEGREILLTNIKRGDLVFFVYERDSVLRIAHVGIAISDYKDGDFEFIHATDSKPCGGVCYSQFSSYEYHYGGARRIIECGE